MVDKGTHKRDAVDNDFEIKTNLHSFFNDGCYFSSDKENMFSFAWFGKLEILLQRKRVQFKFLYFRGPNDERFGDRFFPVNDIYSKELRDLAKEVTISHFNRK